MCGIVGYIGAREGVDVVMDGLRRLEYRGYDSAGIAVVTNGTLDCVKSPGKLKALDDKLASHPLRAQLAIGHPRSGSMARDFGCFEPLKKVSK